MQRKPHTSRKDRKKALNAIRGRRHDDSGRIRKRLKLIFNKSIPSKVIKGIILKTQDTILSKISFPSEVRSSHFLLNQI